MHRFMVADLVVGRTIFEVVELGPTRLDANGGLVGQAKVFAGIEVGVRGGQNVYAEHEDVQAKWGCMGIFGGVFGWRMPSIIGQGGGLQK